jgi:uncharacterized protein (DUF1778 family)
MSNKRRPASLPDGSGEPKRDALLLRLEAGEKEAFKAAADLAGIGVSAWMRERLRRVARQELEEANLPIPFLRPRAGE